MKNFSCLVFACLALFFSPVFAQENADFYNPNVIQDIKITFKEKNWQYTLDSLRINGEKMLVANVDINGKTYQNVGIRYSGSRSFQAGSKRNGLVLKLNLIHREQNHMGYRTLRLSNALRDPSMVREVLSFEIARDYMPAPKANYVNVSVNGGNYGLLVNIENIDRYFLDRVFGTAEGSFFKANPSVEMSEPEGCMKKAYCNLAYEASGSCYLYNYELLSDYGWDDLIELTRVLNQNPEQIGTVLDVDKTLWMLAFNNVLVNLNSYSGSVSENYYLYRDKTGHFNPIIWDMNLSFGSFKNTGHGSDLDLKGLQQMDVNLHETSPEKPLISQLMKNPVYKKLYTSHVRTILYEWFVNGKYLARAKELQKLIESSFSADPAKFYTVEEFKGSLENTTGKRSKIPGIEELMSKRASFLKKEKALAVFPPEFEKPIVKRRDPLMAKGVSDFKIQTKVSKFTRSVHIFFRFEGEGNFLMLPMFDDGQNDDNEAGDGVFGISIPPKKNADVIEYYFQAENAGAVSFDPPRYMFNLYSASLTELNK